MSVIFYGIIPSNPLAHCGDTQYRRGHASRFNGEFRRGQVVTARFVRYDQGNAMLLNEFLKQHRKVETLQATVAQQHKDFEAAVAELKGQIQKVSAQLAEASPSRGGLEASKFATGRIRRGGPAPQVVNNP